MITCQKDRGEWHPSREAEGGQAGGLQWPGCAPALPSPPLAMWGGWGMGTGAVHH